MTLNSLGIIGSALLIIAWLPGTWHVWKKHRSTMPLGYSLLFVTGVALLTFYSYEINDMNFMILNAAVFIFGLYNLIYIPQKSGKLHEIEQEIITHTGRKGKQYHHVKRRDR